VNLRDSELPKATLRPAHDWCMKVVRLIPMDGGVHPDCLVEEAAERRGEFIPFFFICLFQFPGASDWLCL